MTKYKNLFKMDISSKTQENSYLFLKMFIHTKKRKYNADTSLQERRQGKDMIIW
jgi:hypothetical protein